jgi:calcineurin-like phosphoesterase family protein
VLGNHDKLEPFQYIDVGFHSVHTSLEMSIDGIEFVVVHDPSNSCMDRSKLFLCGHTHDFIKVRKNVICLCVELWHYTPVKWNTIKELYIEMKSNNFNITR